MGKENRLCPLQMRVTGHNHILILLGCFEQGFLQIDDFFLHSHYFPADVHMRIECHLVIATAGGMKPPASFANGLSQTLFDIHVDIFQIHREVKLPGFNLRFDIL